MLNKDTKIFGSFSSNPGNNGCLFFNELFKEKKIDAIYKSFYSNDIADSIKAARVLKFSGFAVSMPFKHKCIDFIDKIEGVAKEIQSVNTVININNELTGYNTDWVGVKKYLSKFEKRKVYILGDGNFSKAVQFACKNNNLEFCVINRKNWNEIQDLEESLIFNATPAEVEIQSSKNNIYIDGRPFTSSGKEIAVMQAQEQFKIYQRVL